MSLNECLPATAKTGRLVSLVKTALITPNATVTSGQCITDKITFDEATMFAGTTGRITQIDLLQQATSSGNKKEVDTKLFLSADDFTAVAKGVAFTVANSDQIELGRTLGIIPLTGTWQDLSDTDSVQTTKELNFEIHSGESVALYGQLINNDGTNGFDASGSIMLRIYIEVD